MENDLHLRIAVVDDDATLSSMLSELLTEEGYIVEEFSDGSHAKEAAYKKHYDIFITDINMPELSGIELLRYLREEIRSPAEVIIMTAHAQLNSAIEAVQLGAFDYLQKPFEDLDKVLSLVNGAAQKLLAKRREDNMVKAVMQRTKELLQQQITEKVPQSLQKILDRTEQMVKKLQNPTAPGEQKGEDHVLVGDIQDIGLANLLQMLGTMGKSGVLDMVENGQRGEVWFRNGGMIHARYGKVLGDKAIFRLLNVDSGQFVFRLTKNQPSQEEIQGPTDKIILSCLGSLDEYRRLGKRIPPDNLLVHFKPMGGGKSLAPEDQFAAELATRYPRVGDILDYSSKSDLETINSLIRLRMEGFLDISLAPF